MSMHALDGWALLCGLVAVAAASTAGEPFDPVASGREALAEQGRLPWYDAEKDGLRRIEVTPREDDAKRHSRWARNSQGQTDSSGGSVRDLFWTIMQTLAWIGLGVLAALVIWGLIWAAIRGNPAGGESARVDEERVESPSRIEELPVSVSPDQGDLLAAARAYVDAGNLEKAIIHAFAHQLVELDRNHLIQLTKGKTNRQYLIELRAHPRFIELLSPTMLAFEDVFFGHHELSRERFQACWENLERFHQQLRRVAL